MITYAIRRRQAWTTPEELQQAAEKSRRIGDGEMSDRVCWIRSYVVKEDDGTLGTICIYQATDPASVTEHANRVGMPASEITEIADTVVVRPDPGTAAGT
jgi:hypothetical protein